MHFPPLSREALQLLELLPSWRMRVPAADQEKLGVLLILPTLSAPAEKLWHQIRQAMLALGYDSQALEEAHQINPANARGITELLASKQAAQVLVFGAALSAAVQPHGSQASTQVVSLPSPDEMMANPELKRVAWQVICQHRPAA